MDPNAHSPERSTELVASLAAQHTSIPCEDEGPWHAQFGHLATYGGGYYSYLWARSLSRRVWRHSFEQDPLRREAGERWCEHVLQHGGGRDPRVMMRELLGDATPTMEPHHPATEETGTTVQDAHDALLQLVDL
mmetsp:Transcript_7902/g.17450  ORF Transcript_7902/g.17450 Transcript_7902/m.17450 type:complete len:134 (+) Transcript_7902:88-489(+)